MGPSSILSVIHTVTIGTMLKCKNGIKRYDLKTLHVNGQIKVNWTTYQLLVKVFTLAPTTYTPPPHSS